MDPNVNLAEQGELARGIITDRGACSQDAIELARRVVALDEWLSLKFGYPPDAWDQTGRMTSEAFRSRLRQQLDLARAIEDGPDVVTPEDALKLAEATAALDDQPQAGDPNSEALKRARSTDRDIPA